MSERSLIPVERITSAIVLLRGHKVLLAALYGVEVKALNQAVRRNRERFPTDFMFQLGFKVTVCDLKDRPLRRRLRLAAAKRDLTIRHYVLDAIEERLQQDLGDEGEGLLGLSAKADPILAELWDNPKDAAYDRV